LVFPLPCFCLSNLRTSMSLRTLRQMASSLVSNEAYLEWCSISREITE
jgi:hypothetical protein